MDLQLNRFLVAVSSNQMGMEVLEGLCVSQSQQQPTLQEKQQRDPFPSRYVAGTRPRTVRGITQPSLAELSRTP